LGAPVHLGRYEVTAAPAAWRCSPRSFPPHRGSATLLRKPLTGLVFLVPCRGPLVGSGAWQKHEQYVGLPGISSQYAAQFFGQRRSRSRSTAESSALAVAV
jgi:hypothetical protein